MVFDHDIFTHSARETQEIGKTFARSLTTEAEGNARRGKTQRHPPTLCLYGELGAGKTTFVQGFAEGLGIEARLLSPTFVIVRRYVWAVSRFFYHVDLYRIGEKDLEELGIYEILSDHRSFVAVEWAEKLGSLLPRRRTDIQFSYGNDGSRKINIRYIKNQKSTIKKTY